MVGGAVAVACRARVGIYDVERQLRRLHGPRLGLVVLRQRRDVFTLRQLDPSLPANLERLYAHLNLLDPAAGPPRSGNRWGGSAEIGGSPRATGSRLPVERILEVCARAYAEPSRWQRVRRVAGAGVVVAAVLGASAAAPAAGAALGAPPALAFAAALLALSTLALAGLASRGRGIAGLRLPRGAGWIATLPFALLGGIAGGAWLPAAGVGALPEGLVLGALLGIGTEALLRGFLFGRVLWACGPGAGAVAVIVTAMCHAAAGAALAAAGVLAGPAWGGFLLQAWGALLVGLAAGTARERSESLGPACLAHAVAALAGGGAPVLWHAWRATGLGG
jgi:hypothetical protein